MSQETRFYTTDIDLSPFVPVPLVILKEKHLSAEAKVIYALLLSRTQLSASAKNRGTYTDSNHAVFIYYTQNQLAENSGLTLYSVKKSLKELSDNKLILKVSQGKGNANRLYVFVPDKDFCIDEKEEEPFIPDDHEIPIFADSFYGKTIKVVYDKPEAEIRPG